MFETYYYIDEEKIDCYLSYFYRSKSIKGKRFGVEVNLPFIKISAEGIADRDMSKLSPGQKIILFESILDENALEIFFDLDDPSVDVSTIMPNVFIKIRGTIGVPELVGKIDGMIDLLKGKVGELALENLSGDDKITTKKVLDMLSENHESIPIIIDNRYKAIAAISANNILSSEELDFWDDVSEECEIVAKVTKNCYGSGAVKVFDIGKSYFRLNRAVRRSISNYDEDERYNIFEEGVSFKVEIISIKK